MTLILAQIAGMVSAGSLPHGHTARGGVGIRRLPGHPEEVGCKGGSHAVAPPSLHPGKRQLTSASAWKVCPVVSDHEVTFSRHSADRRSAAAFLHVR